MKRKMYTRIGAVVLAMVLAVPGTGGTFASRAAEAEVPLQSQTQMNSEMELLSVDVYGSGAQRTQDFDDDWKFYLGDAGGAHETAFDDSKWETVSLPHDYSITQEYSQSMEAESGYLPGGTGWYRKHFMVSQEAVGRRLRIDFGGVYMNATVWVNGTELGTHPYGYTPFSFDITDYVNFGAENVLTVKVEHRTPSSRFYSGSGIYRGVDFVATDSVHVELYGTRITTPNLETEKNGTVNMDVKTTVSNAGDADAEVVLTHTVFPKDGTVEQSIGTVSTAAQTVSAGGSAEIAAVLPAYAPLLWDVDSPNMYTVRTEVKVGDEITDTYDTDYGFRYFAFDSDTGFSLNGKNLKLKGVCMHHDQGSLGAAAYYRAIERQVEILKEMGCNSIRVTHNPAADELIEICNKKGMLLVEEAFDGWMRPKNGNYEDYSNYFDSPVAADNKILGAAENMTWAQFDLSAMINRGYNAPSIIMWSLGNEVLEGTGYNGAGYSQTAERLIGWAKALDAARPVTLGDNNLKNGSSISNEMAASLTAAGGIVGMNYADGGTYSYDSIHNSHNDWKLYGSETASSVNSRGIYDRTAGGSQTQDKQLTAYDYSKVGWGAYASEAWYNVVRKDYVAGEYVWTGFDYLGEPTPWNGTASGPRGSWPSPKSSYFGIIDTAGFPKDSYYFYQSQWNDEVTTLHILPAWNQDVVVNGNVPIVVYSDASAVELFFTPAGSAQEVSLGKKVFTKKTTAAGHTYQVYEGADCSKRDYENMYLTWYKAFEPGTLRAVAYREDGSVIADTEGRSSVKTTGPAEKLCVSADRGTITADGKDLAYITVDVADAEGNIIPNAADRVAFNVQGDGVLVGVDNGNAADHDSYQAGNRQAFSGKVLAIVRSTKQSGSFTVTATAEGLEAASVQVTTAGTGMSENQLSGFYMAKNYYVKVGNMPQLPAQLEARYMNGSSEMVDVDWDSVDESLIQQTGRFEVRGRTAKGSVSVNVNMIGEVGAIMNYSATTPVGVAPKLPESRPVALPDGTVLATSFPVTWSEVDEDAYMHVGTVTVEGTANAFGKEFAVTASVRVQNETITIGDSISGQALTLTQDIEKSLQSDNLNAVKDGIADNGAENARWTNYTNSQAGDRTAEITFEYATQQRLGEVVIHFLRDTYSARYPDAGTTEIYISESGTEGSWTKVETTETIGTKESGDKSSGWTTPYTFSFSPVTATFVKVCVTNKDETLEGRSPCTGITEIELKKAMGVYTTNTTADLETLMINGLELTAEQIASGRYGVETPGAEIFAAAADNAAVTVLPAYQDCIKILVESEDHQVRREFAVNLNVVIPTDPSDDSRDYPANKMVATAGSEHSTTETTGDGPASWALDNNMDTWWHTDWEEKPAGKEELYITFSLPEEVKLDALRYLPRNDKRNGSVTKYKVEYTTDGQHWKTAVQEGYWQSEPGWKVAEFTEPIVAKYVRLTGLETDRGDSGSDVMSAVEIRLRRAVSTVAAEVKEGCEDMGTAAVISDAAAGTATFTAAAKEGFRFVKWTAEDGTLVSRDAVTTVAVNADATYYAVFKAAAASTVNVAYGVQNNDSTPNAITTDGTESSAHPLNNITNGNPDDYADISSTDGRINVQLDLGKVYSNIDYLKLWRYRSDNRTYKGTVILVSVDETFDENDVVYNSDKENVFGFGAGTEALYVENTVPDGREIVLPENTSGRHVKICMQGNTGNKWNLDGNNPDADKANHISELEVHAAPADKAALQAKLNEYNAEVDSGYTTATWEAFQNAIADAQAVMRDEKATQSEVEAQCTALDDAFKALAAKFSVHAGYVTGNEGRGNVSVTVSDAPVEKVDPDTSVTFKGMPGAGYAFAGWYSDAAGNHQVSTSRSYSEIVTEDRTLYAKFVANKTELYAAIGNADTKLNREAPNKDNYTEASWSELERAKQAAEALLINDDATPEQVKAAKDRLADAMNLVRKADYSRVNAAIAKMDKLASHEYTEDSWNALVEARNKVDFTLDSTRQAEVDTMAENINTALAGLERHYTVTVVKGTIKKDRKYKYGEMASVTANAPEEGQKFAYWELNGKPVCYVPTYSFYVMTDVTVTAHYVQAEEEVKQQVTMFCNSEYNPDTKQLKFTAKRSLPAGYKVLEHGIIITDSTGWNNFKDNEKELFVIGAQRTKTAKGKTTGLLGNYSARLSCSRTDTWYGKGYVKYQAPDGTVDYAYSEVTSCLATVE